MSKLTCNFLVEQKHLELVPHEMTEEEFWSKFFQSHYFHRERFSGETSNDPFADCAKMDEKGFNFNLVYLKAFAYFNFVIIYFNRYEIYS